MPGGLGLYRSGELAVLQQIFDSVWFQLEQIGRVHADDDGMRQWVSARVFECAKGRDILDFDAIKTAVLKSLCQ
jgi:hypothetical protein